jgi:putative transposase
MARLARVVVPGVPHLVVQRGNRNQEIFLREKDYTAYIDLMAEWCDRLKVKVWAYCLMPNHTNLLCVPKTNDGLALAIGEAHRRYTRLVNDREGWNGHLWQGRFSSCPLESSYVLDAARYVELNPVRSGLRRRIKDWKWSSVRAHLAGENDALVQAKPLLRKKKNWDGFLRDGLSDESLDTLRRHIRTGRPLGSDEFVEGIEDDLGRSLRKRKPGPKPGFKRRAARKTSKKKPAPKPAPKPAVGRGAIKGRKRKTSEA